MTTTLNQAPTAPTQQVGGRPVVETVEKYRGDILNTITGSSGNQRTSAQNSIEFLNALNSLIAGVSSLPTFTNILRAAGVANYATTIANLRRDVVGNAPSIRFEDLPGHNDVQLIITALANYRRYESQEQQNQFDSIYLGQTNETNSSTSQQIEAAAQRALLSGHSLYYRNGKALRISRTNAGGLEAQILDQQGQVSNPQAITATNAADLVTQIQAQSQAIKNTSAENVQPGVEEREKVDYQQIAAAIEFINRGQTPAEREARTGFYSFDKIRLAIRGQGAGEFSVDTLNENGTITTHDTIAQNAVANIIRTNSHKNKEKKDTVDTIDMGKVFDRAKFEGLCKSINESKNGQGSYTLDGKSYVITELKDTTVTPNISYNPPRFTVEYPGRFNKEVTNSEHLHIGNNDHAEPTVPNLAIFLTSNHGIHIHEHAEGHHIFDKKDFCDFMCDGVERNSAHHPREYDIGGQKIKVWKRGGLFGQKYYASIPLENGTTKEISAGSPESLYKVINKKAYKPHKAPETAKEGSSGEKPTGSAEHAETEGKKEEVKHESHGFYEDSVHKVFGHDGHGGIIGGWAGKWLGKAAIGFKNFFPKPIRGVAGSTVNSAVKAGAVGLGIYGGSVALGSSALALAINPAMGVVFAGNMVNRFLKWRKWWPHNKEEGGGHDAHGAGHGGH